MGRYFDDLASPEYLAHYGTKGQKWGVRRFQYEDGSLTPAGRERYGMGERGNKMSDKGRKRYAKDIQKALNKTDDERAYYQRSANKKLFNDDFRKKENLSNAKKDESEIRALIKMAKSAKLSVDSKDVNKFKGSDIENAAQFVGTFLGGPLGAVVVVGAQYANAPSVAGKRYKVTA